MGSSATKAIPHLCTSINNAEEPALLEKAEKEEEEEAEMGKTNYNQLYSLTRCIYEKLLIFF